MQVDKLFWKRFWQNEDYRYSVYIVVLLTSVFLIFYLTTGIYSYFSSKESEKELAGFAVSFFSEKLDEYHPEQSWIGGGVHSVAYRLPMDFARDLHCDQLKDYRVQEGQLYRSPNASLIDNYINLSQSYCIKVITHPRGSRKFYPILQGRVLVLTWLYLS